MIALFGGTFDPVHLGHIAVAQATYELLDLQQPVRLVLAARPYHKANTAEDDVGVRHRFSMLQLACAEDPRLTPDGSDMGRGRPSYTVSLLEERDALHPDETRVWVIGSDAFAELESWYRWQSLFDLANVLVFGRAGFQVSYGPTLSTLIEARRVDRFKPEEHGQLKMVDIELPEISATEIRQNPSRLDGAVSPSVARYIRRHRLYDDN